jgi:hypothetical protein
MQTGAKVARPRWQRARGYDAMARAIVDENRAVHMKHFNSPDSRCVLP